MNVKYFVIEMQVNSEGVGSSLVYSYDNPSEAISKYYLIMAAAFASSIPTHSAVIITSEGKLFQNYSGVHHSQSQATVQEG